MDFNTCALKHCDLFPLIHSFSDTQHWDAFALQEGVRNMTPGILTESGVYIITGHSGDTGAPHLVLNRRLGSRLRQTVLHTHYALAQIRLVPPLKFFSLYLPAFSSHSDAPFAQILESFPNHLLICSGNPRIVCLGGADCNTQLRPARGRIGHFNGAIERHFDKPRADLIQGLIAETGLKAPSSFANLGTLGISWPSQAQKQKPSVLDDIFTSATILATF